MWLACRQNDDGSLTRESNARYVQWSDGSESIMLGDEVLTMDRKQQPRANTYVHVVRYDAIQVRCWVRQMVRQGGAYPANTPHITRLDSTGKGPPFFLLLCHSRALRCEAGCQSNYCTSRVHCVSRVSTVLKLLFIPSTHRWRQLGLCRWRWSVMQGLAHIKQNVHLKPAGLYSKLHKRLKMTVHRATQKSDKVCWAVPNCMWLHWALRI
jgi:hypothetical protein